MPEAIVPKELPHVRPVLLLTVGVVVLSVSPTARPAQLGRPPRQVPVQRPVEELPAVVRVEVFQDIRHGGFQFPQLDEHRFATLVPDGPVLGPPTEKLRKSEGINIITFRGVVAMGHGIRFNGTGPGSIWRTGTSRHGMA